VNIAKLPTLLRKKSPGGIFPYRGFIVSGAGSAFLHRPFPEVRRFISRKQVKMKLASGSPSGLVGGSTPRRIPVVRLYSDSCGTNAAATAAAKPFAQSGGR
jgi:hypothetical protein